MLVLPIAILAMPCGEDRDFMETLYREHYRVMLSAAKRYCGSEADVDDLISDSCMRLMDHIGQLREMDAGQKRLFVMNIVRSTANAYQIKRERAERLFAQEEETDEDELREKEIDLRIGIFDELDSVLEAIDRLPEKEKCVLRMKFQLEMHDAQIAAEIGISEVSVRKYVERARKHLRRRLGLFGEKRP